MEPSVQSKLFDHHAVKLSGRGKMDTGPRRPAIGHQVTVEPDTDTVVFLATSETYLFNSEFYQADPANFDQELALLGRLRELHLALGTPIRFRPISELDEQVLRSRNVSELEIARNKALLEESGILNLQPN